MQCCYAMPYAQCALYSSSFGPSLLSVCKHALGSARAHTVTHIHTITQSRARTHPAGNIVVGDDGYLYARFSKSSYKYTQTNCTKLFQGKLAPYALNETSAAAIDQLCKVQTQPRAPALGFGTGAGLATELEPRGLCTQLWHRGRLRHGHRNPALALSSTTPLTLLPHVRTSGNLLHCLMSMAVFSHYTLQLPCVYCARTQYSMHAYNSITHSPITPLTHRARSAGCMGGTYPTRACQ